MKILVIDDDHSIAKIIIEHLEEGGHIMDCADNARDGLHLALNETFDLIILDRQLPEGVDGLHLLQILRAEGITSSVLILSGRSKVVDHIEGFRAGTDDYLSKPFALKDLDASITSVAERLIGIHSQTASG